MVADLETIMFYLQKRYNIVREISRFTDELMESVEREDMVSTALVLEMRREQMERHAACEDDLRQFIESSGAQCREFHNIAFGVLESEFSMAHYVQDEKELWIRKKIYDIRSRTKTLIQDIRSRDERITRKVKQKK